MNTLGNPHLSLVTTMPYNFRKDVRQRLNNCETLDERQEQAVEIATDITRQFVRGEAPLYVSLNRVRHLLEAFTNEQDMQEGG